MRIYSEETRRAMIEVSEMLHKVRPWDQAKLDRSVALQRRDEQEWLKRRGGGNDGNDAA
jgi:hypothetical protein